jgi:hypothetical protein
MNPFKFIRRRWVIWVWQHTPNCAEMSRLASQRLEQPLSLKLRLKMRVHYLICVWCKRYFKQLDFLHRASPGVDEHLAVFPERSLTSEAKSRIVSRLREALGM